jgi:hypothetical protein
MNQTEIIQKYAMDELAAVFTSLSNLAAVEFPLDNTTGKSISAVASLVNLIRISIGGGFYEEGKKEMLEQLLTTVGTLEEIQG